MSETTVLDLAHLAMEAAPEDDAARLRFFERVADAEMFLLLDADTAEADVTPQVFDTAEGRFVMAFDREERLAAFCDAPAPYAALPGRVIVAQLAGQGIGLGINLGVAPSSFLMGEAAVNWLAGVLAAAPGEAEAAIAGIHAPGHLPRALVAALDMKLALLAGVARQAVLAGVSYRGGRRGHVLAVLGAREGAEAGIAKAVSEALVFSGLEAGEIDVIFPRAGDEVVQRLVQVGIVLDVPVPHAAVRTEPSAPGSDPAKPPRLR
jgi:hypothetical protein